MKSDPWNTIFFLQATLVSFGVSIYMYVNDVHGVGVHGLTQQVTAGGWLFFFLMGSIFLVVTYFSLSPFSKIRRFFERWRR